MGVNRDTIVDRLVPYFKKDKRYHLLICDCGFAKVDKLVEMYPDRIVNCGIMEQGTIGIASGMADSGLIPIVYSIASFIVYRALEQLKVDVVEMDRNVKVIGNGSRDFFKSLGECHWCRDDDVKLMDVIYMPWYNGSEFNDWIGSERGGYIRV